MHTAFLPGSAFGRALVVIPSSTFPCTNLLSLPVPRLLLALLLSLGVSFAITYRMILAVVGEPDYSGILPPFSQLPYHFATNEPQSGFIM